jgi:hypothetical protein
MPSVRASQIGQATPTVNAIGELSMHRARDDRAQGRRAAGGKPDRGEIEMPLTGSFDGRLDASD